MPMTTVTREQAYDLGRQYRERGAFNDASPFYCERLRIGDQTIDVTPELDKCFKAGYDGRPIPEEGFKW